MTRATCAGSSLDGAAGDAKKRRSERIPRLDNAARLL